MKYGGKYWNIKQILPYQRHFNFINGVRSIGKTYTCLGYFIERYLKSGEQFIYIVRTQDEKKAGILSQAMQKVLDIEFPGLECKFSSDACLLDGDIIAHCRALSEVIKIKKQSFPRVKWGVFDEYMLEPKYNSMYVKGWKEPELLLNMYHTIDREEDKVVFFMLGNNTAFYNPYHLHPAFNIPECNPGEIWTSENVLFQWAEASEQLEESRKNNKFLNMIKGTEYDRYASQGEYIGDNKSFVMNMPAKPYFTFAFKLDGTYYGVWTNKNDNRVIISHKVNLNVKPTLSFDVDNAYEGDLIVKRNHYLCKWLGKKMMNGLLYYESMDIKSKVVPTITTFI